MRLAMEKNQGCFVHDALVKAQTLLKRCTFDGRVDKEELRMELDTIDAAVNMGLRECDVGTGEEQTLRFHNFCESHRVPFDPSRGTMCAGAKCPAYNHDANCFFKWAQLPYDESLDETASWRALRKVH